MAARLEAEYKSVGLWLVPQPCPSARPELARIYGSAQSRSIRPHSACSDAQGWQPRMGHIAARVNGAATGARSMAEGVRDVSRLAEQTDTMAAVMSERSALCADQTTGLKGEVSRFLQAVRNS